MPGMLEHLGQTCRDARLAAGLRQIDIATTAGTVSRFESGARWPQAPDDLVAAYAAETATEPVVLWARAIKHWRDA